VNDKSQNSSVPSGQEKDKWEHVIEDMQKLSRE
jgi:hypothetical protein